MEIQALAGGRIRSVNGITTLHLLDLKNAIWVLVTIVRVQATDLPTAPRSHLADNGNLSMGDYNSENMTVHHSG